MSTTSPGTNRGREAGTLRGCVVLHRPVAGHMSLTASTMAWCSWTATSMAHPIIGGAGKWSAWIGRPQGRWTNKGITQATVIYADGLIYTYEGPKKGIVSLVKPSPTGLECVGRFAVTEGSSDHWAHPTIANGKLYIRHRNALVCYDIAQKVESH